MPWEWNLNDKRQEQWKKEREEYGFDERETWNLDYMFDLWFYEHLKMYDEVNCVNTNYYTFEYEGEKLTQQECIDYILDTLKRRLQRKEPNWDTEDLDMVAKEEEKMYQLIIKILPCLWW